ncbi:MAG: glutamate--tRNA ligase [Polyangiales bacterium]
MRTAATRPKRKSPRPAKRTERPEQKPGSENSPWRDAKEPPADPNAPYAIRFRSKQEGVTGWKDLVKGRIDVPNETQQDFILLRGDGMPLYNFGCVVDDLTMGITLVARGDDHVVNTPPQIMLYEALNAAPPSFAHMPMVLAPNGEKLSKRHAAVGVLEYRDMGYLPDAVLNYLARLGWSHGDQEIFTRDELIEKFGWDKVGSNAGRYDAKKFLYVEAEHLRMLPDAEIAARTVPFLKDLGIDVTVDDAKLLEAIPFVKTRAQTLVEVAQNVDYFFRDVEFDEKARTKFLVAGSVEPLLALADLVSQTTPFTQANLEEVTKAWLEEHGWKMKDVAQPARVAMTGRTQSPGLFEVMQVLGKDETVRRLRSAAELSKA